MAVSISVRVQGDEVIAVLNSKKRQLRDAITKKMETLISESLDQLREGKPGKYIDPSTLQHGVEGIGSQTIIGFIESTDKGGFYPITPNKANALRFIAKSGDLVFTKHVSHPYLKSSRFVEQHLLQLKPWLEEQLVDAVEQVF